MLKVLIVFNHPAPYKVRLFNELAKHIDLTVIFERNKAKDRNPSFYEEKKYQFKTIKIHGIKIGKENTVSSGIKKHIKHSKYDLVIMNGYSTFAEMKAINYLIKHNLPYVLYINGGIISKSESKFKRNLKKKFISNASDYLSPDSSSNEFLKFYGANEERIFNYPYSTIYEKEILSSPLSIEEKQSLKEKLGIKEDKVFVSCGQLIPRKNYLNLVKKWNEIRCKHGLYIIGDGPEKKTIEQYIKSNNMDNVHLLDYMRHERLFEFFRACDCFIFPSREDIYGHVVNEALSQGLPVISTDKVNASKKLIKNGYNGYLLNDIESQDLEKMIEDVISNDFIKNAIATARENTIELMAKTHLDIFERILKK